MHPVASIRPSVEETRSRRGPALLLTLLGLSVLSLLVVVASPWWDTDRVASKEDQADVSLGLPVPWLHQDQSSVDPPLPWHLGPASPWEHPTTVAFGAFLADVALVAVVLGLIGWPLRAVIGGAVARRG